MPRPFSRDRDRPSIDGYEDLQLIGRGGYSRVYRAVQPAFDRRVAVKVITARVADVDVDRFAEELRITGRLDGHPNVIRVYDSGRTRDGRPYLSMELFEDGTYASWLRRHGPLRVADVLAMGVRVAGALHAAHERSIIHRDVKPQNILRSPFVGPVLADFGIAGLLERRTGVAAGSEAFSVLHAAPEVLAGGPSTPASDLYSLGSTVYELLTGTPPFHDPERPGILDVIARVDAGDVAAIDRPDLPAEAAATVVALLAPNIADRPRSGLELASRLQELERSLALPVTPIPGHEHVTDRRRSVPDGAPPPDDAHPAPAPPTPTGPLVEDPASTVDPATFTLDPSGAPPAPTRSEAAAPTGRMRAQRRPSDPTLTVDRRAPIAPPRPADDEPDAPRRWPRRLAVGAAALVAVGAATLLVTSLGDDDGTAAPTTTAQPTTAAAPTSAPVPPPPACPDVEVPSLLSPDAPQPPPTAVDVGTVDGRLRVVWVDRSDGATGHVVFVRCTEGGADTASEEVRPIAAVEAGVTSIDLPAVADRRWCVSVGAVQPGSGTRLSEDGEQFVCVNT